MIKEQDCCRSTFFFSLKKGVVCVLLEASLPRCYNLSSSLIYQGLIFSQHYLMHVPTAPGSNIAFTQHEALEFCLVVKHAQRTLFSACHTLRHAVLSCTCWKANMGHLFLCTATALAFHPSCLVSNSWQLGNPSIQVFVVY